MERLVRNSLVLVLFGLAFCWAGVALTSDYDTKNCNVLVHVSEDNESLFLENIHIPGTYMTTSCWGTSATYCHVLDTSSYYKNEMKNIGTKTFTNKSGQICYFRNFGLRTGNMGGFYYQPWSYVYDVAVSVDCEDSSSAPLYCAKSERMAKQVLLAREELKCGEKGGAFEGGVFPVKREGGATEYCVSASCDICDSRWYVDYVNNWKDEHCCEGKKKEPNRNMGTCANPGPMDSTRIGVKTSEVKAFPGCSDIDAGGRDDDNFCIVPGSSSSSESSSSALSSSSEVISSSSEEISSSSEEQETADCYVDEDVADAMLTSREDECWSRQLLPNFKLDHFGCIVGDCEENGSSSSAGDENTGDDLQSSSSEEDGQCRDPSLMKERSNGLDDGWIYVGKEKYSSKIVSYEEAKPAKSGFFDALGRMYKRVKSKIKYYVGKETKVKKTVEVAEELDVWKKVEMIDGREIVSYKKINGIKSVAVDSVIYGDSLYSRSEINLSVNFSKSIDTLGIMRFASYDDNFDLKFVYYIGLPQDVVFDSSGNVNPCGLWRDLIRG